VTNRIIRGYSWFGGVVAVLVVLCGAFVAATDPSANVAYVVGVTALLALIMWGLFRFGSRIFAGFYDRFFPVRPRDRRKDEET
jgi:hypothetical protein